MPALISCPHISHRVAGLAGSLLGNHRPGPACAASAITPQPRRRKWQRDRAPRRDGRVHPGIQHTAAGCPI